jgi:hypothetical protein
MSSKYHEKNYIDTRNYAAEARDITKGLSTNQLHDLYEICYKKSQLANSPTRDKELNAVMKAIELNRSADKSTLNRIKNGYRGEMAATAKAKDGFTKPNRKKV